MTAIALKSRRENSTISGRSVPSRAGIVNGKRRRQVFDSKKDAKIWLRAQKETKRKVQLGFGSLDTNQTADAIAALQILGGHAVLVDAQDPGKNITNCGAGLLVYARLSHATFGQELEPAYARQS